MQLKHEMTRIGDITHCDDTVYMEFNARIEGVSSAAGCHGFQSSIQEITTFS
jgi:hypothetical protein